MRLALLTHRDPVLPLHALRVNGELTEIRAADLAFTPAEIAGLFTSAAIHLRPDQINRIMDRTGGWPAGVRTAALSIDPVDVDAEITRFCAADRSAADNFIEETLQALPPIDRDFLLQTSRTEMVNGDLANQLTGRTDSQAVLEGLFNNNVFTVQHGQQGWYSYQPLLRTLLTILGDAEQPQAAAPTPVSNSGPTPVTGAAGLDRLSRPRSMRSLKRQHPLRAVTARSSLCQ